MKDVASATPEQIVHDLLNTMIERQASDLLISVGVPPSLKCRQGWST
jgi:twitching motility protein PilU